VVKQVVQGVFDGAGDELSLQVNCKKAWAGIDVFVACPIRLRNLTSGLTLIFVLVICSISE
jgi:hypothetical protein